MGSSKHSGNAGMAVPRTVADGNMEDFLESFPFLGADAFAEEAQYSGFGLDLTGQEACSIAMAVWQQQLPTLLRGFAVLSVKMLPPDSRSIVQARYTVSFDAPLPPQVLPAQRDRIRNANLTLT